MAGKSFASALSPRRAICGRRVNSGVEQNLIGVNVADACNQSLVHQDRFHGAAMFRERLLESSKIDIDRIWSEGALFQEFSDLVDQSNLAKLALIVEGEPVVFCENEQQPRVRRCFFLALKVTQRAGHAEMRAQPDVA